MFDSSFPVSSNVRARKGVLILMITLKSSTRRTETTAIGSGIFVTWLVRSSHSSLSVKLIFLLRPGMRHDLPDYETGRQLPFFKDRTMIDAYKTLISQLLNRVNTINGRRYGSDPTVLAWQTGNEMRLGHDKPPPGAWTEEICAVSHASFTRLSMTPLTRSSSSAAHQKFSARHIDRGWQSCQVSSQHRVHLISSDAISNTGVRVHRARLTNRP